MAWPWMPDLDEMSAIADALVRAMAGLEYAPGKRLSPDAVVAMWAEPEEPMAHPSVAVVPGDLQYDSAHVVPALLEETADQASGLVLVEDCEAVVRVGVQIYATDPVQRAMLVRAIRERLQADDGSYGVSLDCPRYFGGAARVRATPLSVRYEDDSVSALERERKAVMTVECRLPVLRVTEATGLMPRLRVVTNAEEG